MPELPDMPATVRGPLHPTTDSSLKSVWRCFKDVLKFKIESFLPGVKQEQLPVVTCRSSILQGIEGLSRALRINLVFHLSEMDT